MAHKFSRFKINILVLMLIYKTRKILRHINKAEKTCAACEQVDCAVITHLDKFKSLRDCIDSVVEQKKDVLYSFVAPVVARLGEDVDNIVENYSIGSDTELVRLVSSLSNRVSK